jgi:hypothetical protein
MWLSYPFRDILISVIPQFVRPMSMYKYILMSSIVIIGVMLKYLNLTADHRRMNCGWFYYCMFIKR